MRSPGEFLSGKFLKVKYTRQLSTEYPPELRRVPGPIESTAIQMRKKNIVRSVLSIRFEVGGYLGTAPAGVI